MKKIALKNRVFKDIGLKKVSWIHQGNIKTVSNEKRAAFVKKSIEVVS
ncbi:hypothetical protein [Listeria seeligeri]|nr:hypothetical protein [Listeria seeligeri]